MSNGKKNEDIKNIENIENIKSIEKLTDAIGFIDDGMISEYDEMYKKGNTERSKVPHISLWRRAVPLAACFMLIIGGVVFALGGLGWNLSGSLDGDPGYAAEKSDGNIWDIWHNKPEKTDGAATPDQDADDASMAQKDEAEEPDPVEKDGDTFPDLEELLKLSDEEIKAVIRSNSNYYKTYVYHWNSHISQNTSNSCNFSVDNGSNITFTWDESGNIDDIIIDRATSDT